MKTNLNKEIASRDFKNNYYKFIGYLPNPDAILNKTGKTIEAYKNLKNDPHVWACIQSRKSGLLCLDYSIIPDNSNIQVVEEIERIINDIDIHQLERDILETLLFGYQPIEIIWDYNNESSNKIIPTKLVAKPQEWFGFDFNGNLCIKNDSGSLQEVPRFKFLNIQYESSYMNPYGTSLLSKCYWPVTFKNAGLKFWVNFTEKYGMPILMGQYTRGSTQDEIQKLADELANMTEDAVIVAPSDIKVEMHEAVRSTSVELYRDLIKYCNAEISKALLSQTLTTELDMGSYAASQTHFKIRKEVILSDIRLVEETVNQLIKYYVELNYGKIPFPKFKLILNDSENAQLLERDLKIMQNGKIQLTKSYWINKYGFKEEEIEIV